MTTVKKLLESPLVSFRKLSDEPQQQQDDRPRDSSSEYSDDEHSDDVSNGADDPDRQGEIRHVTNAHLVFKRKDERNQFTELWIYKENALQKKTNKTYDAIIAGTDIPRGQRTSEDGSQTVSVWEIGSPTNTLVYVELKGLPN